MSIFYVRELVQLEPAARIARYSDKCAPNALFPMSVVSASTPAAHDPGVSVIRFVSIICAFRAEEASEVDS